MGLRQKVTKHHLLPLFPGSRSVDVGMTREMRASRVKGRLSKTKDFCIIHIAKELGQVPQGRSLVSQEAGAGFQVQDLPGLQSGSKPDLIFKTSVFKYKRRGAGDTAQWESLTQNGSPWVQSTVT